MYLLINLSNVYIYPSRSMFTLIYIAQCLHLFMLPKVYTYQSCPMLTPIYVARCVPFEQSCPLFLFYLWPPLFTLHICFQLPRTTLTSKSMYYFSRVEVHFGICYNYCHVSFNILQSKIRKPDRDQLTCVITGTFFAPFRLVYILCECDFNHLLWQTFAFHPSTISNDGT